MRLKSIPVKGVPVVLTDGSLKALDGGSHRLLQLDHVHTIVQGLKPTQHNTTLGTRQVSISGLNLDIWAIFHL